MDHHHGLTAIELVTALAVLGVLVAIGVPGFTALIANNQLSSTTNQLMTAAYFTRMEALRFNQTVTMCPSEDGETCSTNAWEQGWIVYRNPQREPQPVSADAILRQDRLSPNRRLTMSGNTPLRNYISYNGLGISRRHTGALQMGSITLCRDGYGRRFVLNAGGRPRAENMRCDED